MDRNTFLKIAGATVASLPALKLFGGNQKTQELKDEDFKFALSPYIISLTSDEGFIVFATNKPSLAEVELTFQDGSKRKFYDSQNSAGIKNSGSLHAVKLFGLKAGDTVKYTVSAVEILKHWARIDKIEGRFEMGRKIDTQEKSFNVPSSSGNTKIAFVTDIHGRAETMRSMLSPMHDADMLVMDGDMDLWLNTRDDIFKRFLGEVSNFANGSKPVYYARGNHECRGKLAERFSDYAPFPNGKTYCGFRKGSAYILILDSCEMAADTSKTNGGFIDLENWQRQEALWLKEEIKKPEFINAKFRIVFQHIPIYTDDKRMHNAKGTRMNAYNKFRKKLFYDDILKHANISLMINGHTHQYMWASDIDGLNFPVFVCSNKEAARLNIDDKNIKIEIFNSAGEKSRPDININAKA